MYTLRSSAYQKLSYMEGLALVLYILPCYYILCA